MVKVFCAPILALVEHMKNVLGMYGIEAAVTHCWHCGAELI